MGGFQEWNSKSHRFAIPTLINIYTNPTFMNSKKLIGYPSRSAIPIVTTFAEAPSMVPLPPKHAPKPKAHQRTLSSAPGMASKRYAATGSMVAVNGILSTKALTIAETHKTRQMAAIEHLLPWH